MNSHGLPEGTVDAEGSEFECAASVPPIHNKSPPTWPACSASTWHKLGEMLLTYNAIQSG
jgi:hypothetical protein